MGPSQQAPAIFVDAGPDAADDWIAERAGAGDIVVTNDIPLADRALRAGAQALSPTGRPFTQNSIGAALAQRAPPHEVETTGASISLRGDSSGA